MKRLVGAVLTAGLLGGLIGGSSVVAWAEPGEADYIQIHWDGQTNHLAWDGSGHTIAECRVVDLPVVTPGDRVERTAIIKNAGPSEAEVTVQLLNLSSAGATGTHNQDFEEAMWLFWDINGHRGEGQWRDLLAHHDDEGVAYSVSFPLAKGAEFPITIGFHFPIESTAGGADDHPDCALNFDIQVIMKGQEGSHVLTTINNLLSNPTTIQGVGAFLALSTVGLATGRLAQRRASVAQR